MDLLGGFGYPSIEGENCLIHCAKNGKTFTGTILMHQTSVHVYRDASTAEATRPTIKSDWTKKDHC